MNLQPKKKLFGPTDSLVSAEIHSISINDTNVKKVRATLTRWVNSIVTKHNIVNINRLFCLLCFFIETCS